MHQNKFHTERIQQLTIKYQMSTRGGPPLDDSEQKLADHLKILYKFANKGIKGRGKKETELKPSVTSSTTETTTRTEPPPSERVFTSEQQSLLPLPARIKSTLRRGMAETASFGSVSSGTSSWSRGEDVYIGNQGGGQLQHQQSNSFLGIPGDGSSTTSGIGGYGFGGIV